MPETRGVPEIYADFVQIATGDLGIFLGFRSVQPLQAIPLETEDEAQRPEMPTELKGVVRFSQTEMDPEFRTGRQVRVPLLN
jgi:hypothetical protein